ncbi:TBC1D25 [Cordylochernes scorpioides]|uniref:TBC1D25 n=1 Tax=Cordylochernes scorpioides TaxID=51811 RepID=A0ABY6L8B5_9ARAC|nr:TBC1D25 [Cordylochernes scorpioides]
MCSEFSLCYQTGPETYQSLTSDWDLDAALDAYADPHLTLLVREHVWDGPSGWDLVVPADYVVPPACLALLGPAPPSPPPAVSWLRRTLSVVFGGRGTRDEKPPMTEAEYSLYVDINGKMIRPRDLFIAVYRGGLSGPGLRREVWPHLLNVYPAGFTATQRAAYLRSKCEAYRGLSRHPVSDNILEMVRKDVLRTDRQHSFFAGEDNANVQALHRLLSTYAVHHPQLGYCQGMSDLAAPILATMQDEAVSYLCFCGLMRRLSSNFTSGGKNMATMFQHLALLLRHYDPQLYYYLEAQGARDLLFCYRWLLLELKREFPFQDALLLLEVVWSSIPPDPPQYDLPLAQAEEDEGIDSYSLSSQSAASSNFDDSNQWSSLDHSPEDSPLPEEEEEEENTPFLSPKTSIPPPEELGCGNPFLLFVCLVLLVQHRNYLLENTLEFSDIGMYFDKLVRRHDAKKALLQARALFEEYLLTGTLEPIS